MSLQMNEENGNSVIPRINKGPFVRIKKLKPSDYKQLVSKMETIGDKKKVETVEKSLELQNKNNYELSFEKRESSTEPAKKTCGKPVGVNSSSVRFNPTLKPSKQAKPSMDINLKSLENDSGASKSNSKNTLNFTDKVKTTEHFTHVCEPAVKKSPEPNNDLKNREIMHGDKMSCLAKKDNRNHTAGIESTNTNRTSFGQKYTRHPNQSKVHDAFETRIGQKRTYSGPKNVLCMPQKRTKLKKRTNPGKGALKKSKSTDYKKPPVNPVSESCSDESSDEWKLFLLGYQKDTAHKIPKQNSSKSKICMNKPVFEPFVTSVEQARNEIKVSKPPLKRRINSTDTSKANPKIRKLSNKIQEKIKDENAVSCERPLTSLLEGNSDDNLNIPAPEVDTSQRCQNGSDMDQNHPSEVSNETLDDSMNMLEIVLLQDNSTGDVEDVIENFKIILANEKRDAPTAINGNHEAQLEVDPSTKNPKSNSKKMKNVLGNKQNKVKKIQNSNPKHQSNLKAGPSSEQRPVSYKESSNSNISTQYTPQQKSNTKKITKEKSTIAHTKSKEKNSSKLKKFSKPKIHSSTVTNTKSSQSPCSTSNTINNQPKSGGTVEPVKVKGSKKFLTSIQKTMRNKRVHITKRNSPGDHGRHVKNPKPNEIENCKNELFRQKECKRREKYEIGDVPASLEDTENGTQEPSSYRNEVSSLHDETGIQASITLTTVFESRFSEKNESSEKLESSALVECNTLITSEDPHSSSNNVIEPSSDIHWQSQSMIANGDVCGIKITDVRSGDSFHEEAGVGIQDSSTSHSCQQFYGSDEAAIDKDDGAIEKPDTKQPFKAEKDVPPENVDAREKTIKKEKLTENEECPDGKTICLDDDLVFLGVFPRDNTSGSKNASVEKALEADSITNETGREIKITPNETIPPEASTTVDENTPHSDSDCQIVFEKRRTTTSNNQSEEIKRLQCLTFKITYSVMASMLSDISISDLFSSQLTSEIKRIENAFENHEPKPSTSKQSDFNVVFASQPVPAVQEAGKCYDSVSENDNPVPQETRLSVLLELLRMSPLIRTESAVDYMKQIFCFIQSMESSVKTNSSAKNKSKVTPAQADLKKSVLDWFMEKLENSTVADNDSKTDGNAESSANKAIAMDNIFDFVTKIAVSDKQISQPSMEECSSVNSNFTETDNSSSSPQRNFDDLSSIFGTATASAISDTSLGFELNIKENPDIRNNVLANYLAKKIEKLNFHSLIKKEIDSSEFEIKSKEDKTDGLLRNDTQKLNSSVVKSEKNYEKDSCDLNYDYDSYTNAAVESACNNLPSDNEIHSERRNENQSLTTENECEKEIKKVVENNIIARAKVTVTNENTSCKHSLITNECSQYEQMQDLSSLMPETPLPVNMNKESNLSSIQFGLNEGNAKTLQLTALSTNPIVPESIYGNDENHSETKSLSCHKMERNHNEQGQVIQNGDFETEREIDLTGEYNPIVDHHPFVPTVSEFCNISSNNSKHSVNSSPPPPLIKNNDQPTMIHSPPLKTSSPLNAYEVENNMFKHTTASDEACYNNITASPKCNEIVNCTDDYGIDDLTIIDGTVDELELNFASISSLQDLENQAKAYTTETEVSSSNNSNISLIGIEGNKVSSSSNGVRSENRQKFSGIIETAHSIEEAKADNSKNNFHEALKNMSYFETSKHETRSMYCRSVSANQFLFDENMRKPNTSEMVINTSEIRDAEKNKDTNGTPFRCKDIVDKIISSNSETSENGTQLKMIEKAQDTIGSSKQNAIGFPAMQFQQINAEYNGPERQTLMNNSYISSDKSNEFSRNAENSSSVRDENATMSHKRSLETEDDLEESQKRALPKLALRKLDGVWQPSSVGLPGMINDTLQNDQEIQQNEDKRQKRKKRSATRCRELLRQVYVITDEINNLKQMELRKDGDIRTANKKLISKRNRLKVLKKQLSKFNEINMNNVYSDDDDQAEKDIVLITPAEKDKTAAVEQTVLSEKDLYITSRVEYNGSSDLIKSPTFFYPKPSCDNRTSKQNLRLLCSFNKSTQTLIPQKTSLREIHGQSQTAQSRGDRVRSMPALLELSNAKASTYRNCQSSGNVEISNVTSFNKTLDLRNTGRYELLPSNLERANIISKSNDQSLRQTKDLQSTESESNDNRFIGSTTPRTPRRVFVPLPIRLLPQYSDGLRASAVFPKVMKPKVVKQLLNIPPEIEQSNLIRIQPLRDTLSNFNAPLMGISPYSNLRKSRKSLLSTSNDKINSSEEGNNEIFRSFSCHTPQERAVNQNRINPCVDQFASYRRFINSISSCGTCHQTNPIKLTTPSQFFCNSFDVHRKQLQNSSKAKNCSSKTTESYNNNCVQLSNINGRYAPLSNASEIACSLNVMQPHQPFNRSNATLMKGNIYSGVSNRSEERTNNLPSTFTQTNKKTDGISSFLSNVQNADNTNRNEVSGFSSHGSMERLNRYWCPKAYPRRLINPETQIRSVPYLHPVQQPKTNPRIGLSAMDSFVGEPNVLVMASPARVLDPPVTKQIPIAEKACSLQTHPTDGPRPQKSPPGNKFYPSTVYRNQVKHPHQQMIQPSIRLASTIQTLTPQTSPSCVTSSLVTYHTPFNSPRQKTTFSPTSNSFIPEYVLTNPSEISTWSALDTPQSSPLRNPTYCVGSNASSKKIVSLSGGYLMVAATPNECLENGANVPLNYTNYQPQHKSCSDQ